jgi:hypothetical protein
VNAKKKPNSSEMSRNSSLDFVKFINQTYQKVQFLAAPGNHFLRDLALLASIEFRGKDEIQQLEKMQSSDLSLKHRSRFVVNFHESESIITAFRTHDFRDP